MVTPVEDLGWSATRFVVDLGRLALFGFQVVRAALAPPLRVRLFVQEVFKLGVLSLIIISVCGLAVGMVLSLQGTTRSCASGRSSRSGRWSASA